MSPAGPRWRIYRSVFGSWIRARTADLPLRTVRIFIAIGIEDRLPTVAVVEIGRGNKFPILREARSSGALPGEGLIRNYCTGAIKQTYKEEAVGSMCQSTSVFPSPLNECLASNHGRFS